MYEQVKELTPEESKDYLGCGWCCEAEAEVLLRDTRGGHIFAHSTGLLGDTRGACKSCAECVLREE